MTVCSQVAIIGAGPYGLSIAAHLRAHKVEFRIFGSSMHSWRAKMPAGMFLKSEGFASNLYDPEGRCTLKRFCAQNSLAYSDYGIPVSLKAFTAYGLSFQEQLVPNLEERAVNAVDRCPDAFLLRLDNGETVVARRVVVAVGATYFRHIPATLDHLSPEVLSHSSDHHDLSRFKGRNVSVIGGGASALDIVAGLLEVGADVRLVARRTSLKWNAPVLYRPKWKRWYPMSGLGGGLHNRFYETAPMLFRCLPQQTRLRIVRTWLGPAGAWPIKHCVERAPLLLGHALRGADFRDGRVHLRLASYNGEECERPTDHIIAATGYKVDLRRLPFLSKELCLQLRSVEHTPILSSEFQSSVPGLYFVGLASANTFGPAMRFVVGARYTARRLASRFA